MTADESRATVLVVDDEAAYLNAYASWLSERYDVRTATDGEEALSELDGGIDVVLLDRRMPGRSGGEVLDRIRERAVDPRVAMITAVEPDVDIVDMPFDEYLLKPITKDDLHSLVENLLARARLDEHVRECFALASKKAALESALTTEERETSDEYQRLRRRLEAAEAEADRALEDLLEENEPAAAYYDM